MPRFTRQSRDTARARRLRKMPTEAEARLWQHFRSVQLGATFRRQHPLRGFVVDFYCPSARLAVELDGGQHARQGEADRRRTQILVRHGVTVLRFWNNEVLENPDGVIAAVGAVLVEIERRSLGRGEGVTAPLASADGAPAATERGGADIRIDGLDVVFGEPG